MTRTLARPYPLGATLGNTGCNFSIYSPDCKSLSLALFDENDEFTTYKLENEYADIRYVFIDGIKAGQKYGFIADTDNGPILLSDPYAKAISEPLDYVTPYTNEKSFAMAKCVVIDDTFDWQGVEKPRISREETVLFETHVKGLSQLHPEVATNTKGRYLGLVSPEMLAFYKQQNINSLQLLPIAACMHEPHLLDMGKVNYWGYNPYLFMVPDPRYAEKDAVTELKTAIRELHRNGIEVILDVVYNHTAEGGEGGTTFNLKALDSRYYIKHGCHYANFTGCGNTVDLTHQPALNLVMDTLRYWVNEFQVDGFRFDLAATLGREGDNYNPEAAFFKAVAQDPVLKETKLIAEPWDIGPNGYQVGNFPLGWNECNDKLRDITRSFWRGDQGYLKEFATRLMGSRDIYSAAHWPYKLTVNYITYHDGFTMQDLVSYKHKHNEENGENNRDGHGDNRSENYGVEGETENLLVIATREKQKRNFMASLLFAFGIPHILTADVLSHTQKGNNNAYCQDGVTSWLNWEDSERKTYFKTWLSEMISARQQYMVPFIKAFSGEKRNSNRIFWSRVDGTLMEHDDWNRLSSVALHLGIGKNGDELIYLINQTNAPARFSLPSDRDQNWVKICDTNLRNVKPGHAEGEMLLSPTSMAILHYSPGKTELS
ncbi:putative GLYCOGEN DEBRANCHING ENZYME [Vibrio crassostreae]|uniref:Putative GLYCOGEN DEBRANCHING ENZYME n=1 Tax=Vibrio crassostreae TaxID=246167 RepID=A0A822N246_9VIBR|nr:glycogen debranching protein GlgX [Vibrio crassostreae]MDH5950111.1 glycogen debranching protein GlgX [Vibrio crassostreae]TCN06832.1 glycogen operon protein [Vibrio crassostreae]TCU06850.1 glycogen operon protein [Vibrio crassostreae]CAK1692130.1 putative GLYCOGEN DEBRANCHING ENZYME [Vibrio crassostreae]CAK1724101.1 putative GLYCOGEN DEBRANCHING ENZYME [Vibrio crassostreae]